MLDGKILWNYPLKTKFDISILSASEKRDISVCKTGKIIWCKRNLGPHVQIILENEKWKYATPTRILIDNLEKNIIPCKQHGVFAYYTHQQRIQ